MKHLKNHGVYPPLFVPLLFLLSSCVHSKNIAYFHDLDDTARIHVQDSVKDAVTLIQPGDLLDIYVSSASAASSAPFNMAEAAPAGGSAPAAQTTGASRGYRVEVDSMIDYPVLGRIKAGGLTIATLRDTLTNRLEDYLKTPHVHVRFLNYKITVLGEVSRPSSYTFGDEKVTLIDALGMAGDLTIYGRRDNITVIREEGGRRTFAKLDLRSSKVFLSPYYFLKQNDIVYVEPNKTKAANADDRTVRNISLATGLLAIVISLVYLLK